MAEYPARLRISSILFGANVSRRAKSVLPEVSSELGLYSPLSRWNTACEIHLEGGRLAQLVVESRKHSPEAG